MSVTPRRVLQLSLLVAALTSLAFAGAAAAKGKSRAAQAQASLAADSLRPPLTRDNFYFLMPDRFANVHPALADEAEQNRFSSPEAGIFAFSRIDAGDQVEYLIALNNAETATTASLETYLTRWGPPPARNVRR
jgi:hypothetical protein